eukprot:3642036-Pleurochrysis_carterae.AAC.1
MGCSTSQLGCLVPRPPALAMILQLRTLYKIKADGRKKARCVLGEHRLPPARDFEHTFLPTVKHTTPRTVLAVAAEHDLDVQGGGITQAYPLADWLTDQKVYAHIPEGYKRMDKNGREMVAEVGNHKLIDAGPVRCHPLGA